MMPQAGLTNEEVALVMAPWVFPYYYWATACGLCVLNYRVMTELMSAPPSPTSGPWTAPSGAGPGPAEAATAKRTAAAPRYGFT